MLLRGYSMGLHLLHQTNQSENGIRHFVGQFLQNGEAPIFSLIAG